MGFLSFFFAVVLGTFLGVFAGARKGSVFDNVLITGTTIGGAVPLYWVGILLVYTFSVLLKDTPVWLPPSGRISPQMNLSPIQDIWGLSPVGFWLTLFNFISNFYIVNTIFTGNWKGLCDVVAHLFLPSLTLSIAPMSLIARMTRASVLEVFTHNYIQTAYAKGLSNLLVIYKHVAANALLPIITILGLSLGNLLSGTVLVETIFGLSGLGKTLYESVLARDYAVIQAFTLLVAIIVIFANMLADIAYTYLNPRVRL
jgi:peptide/nickel transport system permease protein